QWKINEHWLLSAGITYEHLKTPVAFFNGPVADVDESKSKLSPKGGFVWTPCHNTTLRAAYSQGIGAVLTDQDYQLEPAQIVGFAQTLRNVIPQSITDTPLAGPTWDMWQVSFEQRFGKRTFIQMYGEVYTADDDPGDGAFR